MDSKLSDCIVTCDNKGRVKLWRIDFSDTIMEVKLDS